VDLYLSSETSGPETEVPVSIPRRRLKKSQKYYIESVTFWAGGRLVRVHLREGVREDLNSKTDFPQ